MLPFGNSPGSPWQKGVLDFLGTKAISRPPANLRNRQRQANFTVCTRNLAEKRRQFVFLVA